MAETTAEIARKNRILVVDDEVSTQKGLTRLLESWGHQAIAASDAPTAVEQALRYSPELVLTDLNMPGRSGIELLEDLREAGVEATVVVVTGHATIETAVKATRGGAYEYLLKPLDVTHLKAVVNRGLERSSMVREMRLLRRELGREGRLGPLVGNSPEVLRLYQLLEQVGPSYASVLITGESGTGKELVARTLHSLSPRRKAPFVALNCSAIPESLLESELFGHERGAFTGASTARAGCFELASGGTIFLDEIGEMPLNLQKKLLRVLEDRRVRRLGGGVEIEVDVRIVSATNADVQRLLRTNTFREDLYYRLNVFSIELPPLRDRRSDIPILAHHFLKQLAMANDKPIHHIHENAMDLLNRYDWPGNIRELRNAIERAVVVCSGGELQAHHLPEALRTPNARPSVNGTGVHVPVGTALDDAERMVILDTLSRMDGNKTQTARVLGITPKTLHLKLKKYGERSH
ncbi:MAG: sigma-54-dependent Fis family transcriptional regulator [Candidatus Eisenbacteria bacterium]|uniref:Sigma-54-dependent Fis family transcriptional regulator n=1 Tax=Eiseniibacteriota bacterium TaxID=2212470 RepID=A0A7Y2H311_UNCEI|nr:sigma-54-dependent Fis family transcriptional regulator [Candidatus Eisenbacteria bacterium]